MSARSKLEAAERKRDPGDLLLKAKARGAAKKTLRKEASRRAKKAKLGSGARFRELAAKAKASGARNPAAVAATAGRKAHGNAVMARLAAAGRRRSR